ncbi:16S rRNA (cytosine(1402)-N(4))-methyltransferase RsmH [bacterium]|nr:16S rRNA (cytosine(1402)-N(4))-methyltransferase RsmH [bacterium]
MSNSVISRKLYHRPVMLKETLEEIALVPTSGWIVDGTFGDGGHSSAIYEQRIVNFGANKLVSIDWDLSGYEAFKTHSKVIPTLLDESQSESTWILVNDNFSHLQKIVSELKRKTSHGTGIAAVLLDLGISSRQLVQKERGFSFTGTGRADMRMNPEMYAIAAYDLLNLLPYTKLTQLFKETVGMPGPVAARLTRELLAAREEKPFGNTRDVKRLNDIAYKVEPIRSNSRGRIHPATLLFLALRIAVNTELQNLQEVLPVAFANLVTGGRLLVMTYHSAEEEVVAQFSQLVRTKAEIIMPSPREIRSNPRARSAKLFVIKK